MNRKTLVISFFLLCYSMAGQAGLLDKITNLNKTDAEQLEEKKQQLQNRLLEVEKNYGETAAALKNLQAQITQVQQNLGKNQQDRLAYQKQIDKHRQQLAEQVKAAYAIGRREKLKIMLNQQNPALSSRMMLYYNYLNKARLKKLDDINAALKYQSQLEQQQQLDSEQLKKTLEQQKSTQQTLDSVKQERNQLLEQLKRDFSSRQQRLKDLKESETKLKGLINTLQEDGKPEPESQPANQPATSPEPPKTNTDFTVLKGKLSWPVTGTTRKFGMVRAKGVWDGVLIHANEGTEVRAVADGKVAYADPLQGYGSLIIIDHGQGYMTVHGFNQSLYKKVGEVIKAGDIIATVGKSGGRKQSGLYFAIRKQGMPIDPFDWCIKQNK